MSVVKKASPAYPGWSYRVPAVEPEWRSLPAEDPGWEDEDDEENSLGRIIVSELGLKGPALQTIW